MKSRSQNDEIWTKIPNRQKDAADVIGVSKKMDDDRR